MKIKKALLLTFTALVLPMFAISLQAQVAGPPEYVDYQGVVFDSTSGAPLGSTGTVGNYVADPTNYTIHFKIFDTPSGGVPIWAESQTVTVSLGSFAVRLGAGAKISTLPVAAPQAFIKDAFKGKERFLELTVFPPSNPAVGSKIVPRLAFQSSPFALVAGHAKVADSITGGVISGTINADGSIFSSGTFSNSTLTGSVTATGSTVTEGTFTSGVFDGSFSGNGSGLNNLNGASLDNGSVSDVKLTSNVALLNRSSQVFSGTTNRFAGKVGIGGTPNLDYSLQVSSSDATVAIGTSSSVSSANAVIGAIKFKNNTNGPQAGIEAHVGPESNNNNADLRFYTSQDWSASNTYQERMRIQRNGNIDISGFVGIGIEATPQYAQLVINKGAAVNGLAGAYLNASGAGGPTIHAAREISILAVGAIWTSDMFIASSDARIKNVKGISDSLTDLNTLLNIEVTDYSYKDVIQKGDALQKKVIAQQVEAVFPQAVSKRTNVIPDIYKAAEYKDGWVELETDLKVGERVQLITKDDTKSVCDVLEVEKDKFRPDFKGQEEEQLFVIGREVEDFRTVDYDSIFMLNVSATQQIKQEKDVEVKALHAEVERLRAQLAQQAKQVTQLKAKDEARDAQLKAIEKLLSSSNLKVKQTVSQKGAAENAH